MGLCESKSEIPEKNNLKNSYKSNKGYNIDYSKDTSNQKFPDMPLWNNGKKVGFGIKEMPAYKCDLKINELNAIREKFWRSHKTNTYQWNIIHQACVYPHIKAEEFLAKHNFRTMDGCINMCVDENGNIYRVPNYCINDPYFELELNPISGGNENKFVNVILFDANRKIKKEINLRETTTGQDIMNLYARNNNIDLRYNKINLLFAGGIIRNNETLYQHKVKSGQIIQICIFKNN